MAPQWLPETALCQRPYLAKVTFARLPSEIKCSTHVECRQFGSPAYASLRQPSRRAIVAERVPLVPHATGPALWGEQPKCDALQRHPPRKLEPPRLRSSDAVVEPLLLEAVVPVQPVLSPARLPQGDHPIQEAEGGRSDEENAGVKDGVQ